MTVRVKQLMQEIDALSAEERKELTASLRTHEDSPTYLTPDAARPMIKEMLEEHSELFKKLAQ